MTADNLCSHVRTCIILAFSTIDTTKQLRVVGLVYIAVHGNVNGDLTDAKAVRFISQIIDFTLNTLENDTSIAHGICIIRPNVSLVEIYNRTCKVNAKN